MKQNKTEIFKSRLTPTQKRRLKKLAEQNNTTMSKLIQGMIDEATASGNNQLAAAITFVSRHPDTRGLLEFLATSEEALAKYHTVLSPSTLEAWKAAHMALSADLARRGNAALEKSKKQIEN